MNFLKEPMLARETVRRPSAFFGSTELGAILKEVGPIGCLDIGARGGVVEDISPLGEAAFVYGFEPDDEECARLNRTLETGGQPVQPEIGFDGDRIRLLALAKLSWIVAAMIEIPGPELLGIDAAGP